MKNVGWLVVSALQSAANPEDIQQLIKRVSLDKAPTYGIPNPENLDDATLEVLVTTFPDLLPRLVSVADSTTETMERVIRMPHKPKAAIVNKVPMHHGKLSDFAVDYVMRHGGKKALETLLERHIYYLPVSVTLEAQRELFYRYKTVFYLTPHDAAFTYVPPNNRPPVMHRAFLEQSLSLLSEVEEKHIERPNFTPTVLEVLNDASWAGFDTSKCRVVREGWTQPSTSTLLDLLIGRGSEDPYATLMHATFNRGVPMTVVYNKDLLDLIETCTPEEQARVYSACPSWAVLERLEDPASAMVPNGPRPEQTEFHVPSYNLIRKLHIRHATVAGTRSAVAVFMRLLVSELGKDQAKWATFQGLYEEWDQTVGELIDTVQSLH